MNGRGTPPRRVLFLGWQLVWTDVVGDSEQSRTVDQLQQSFTQDATGGATDFDEIATGEAFAIVRIPRFVRTTPV